MCVCIHIHDTYTYIYIYKFIDINMLYLTGSPEATDARTRRTRSRPRKASMPKIAAARTKRSSTTFVWGEILKSHKP